MKEGHFQEDSENDLHQADHETEFRKGMTNSGDNKKLGIKNYSAAPAAEPAEKRSIIGRKSVRAIMQEVAKRIQMLKTNQGEWRALQQRIGILTFMYAYE